MTNEVSRRQHGSHRNRGDYFTVEHGPRGALNPHSFCIEPPGRSRDRACKVDHAGYLTCLHGIDCHSHWRVQVYAFVHMILTLDTPGTGVCSERQKCLAEQRLISIYSDWYQLKG